MFRPIALLLVLAAPVAAEPISVVTDIAPVQSLVAMVLGEVPTALNEQGNDPHDFRFRPSQIRELAAADILFTASPDLIPWLADEAAAISPDLAIEPLGEAGNAHAWLSPVTAAGWLDRIASSLATLDPDNAETYRTRAAEAAEPLAVLDADLARTLAPVRELGLLVDHDAYSALAGRYGLNVVAAISDVQARAPGAAHLRDLNGMIADGRVGCLLAEVGEGQDYAGMLGAEGAIPVVTIDPLGALISPGPDHYAGLMRALASAIAGCSGR